MSFDIGAFFDGIPLDMALRAGTVLSAFLFVGWILYCVSKHEHGKSMWRPIKGTTLLGVMTVALYVAAGMVK